MDYYVKQRIFSFKDQFTVYDGNEKPLYKVEGKLFSFANQLAITTVDGNPVLQIKERLFSFLPHYTISNEEKELCYVTKKLTFFRAKYEINPLNWTIEGSLLDHHYRVVGDGKEIMNVEKQWLSWGDTYHLTIHDQRHETIGIALMIVLDMVHHQKKKTIQTSNTKKAPRKSRRFWCLLHTAFNC